jgi:hypothetical protein
MCLTLLEYLQGGGRGGVSELLRRILSLVQLGLNG